MIIPEKDKGLKSFRIPGIVFRSLTFIIVLVSTLIGIFLYDYVKIVGQINENKLLTLENRQLRDQIQRFQNKINTLASDLQRINTFEKKLRIITGLESQENARIPIKPSSTDDSDQMMEKSPEENSKEKQTSLPNKTQNFKLNLDFKNIKEQKLYKEYKELYDNKIAANLGLTNDYNITKNLSRMLKNSFELSSIYSEFDYKYSEIKSVVSSLETKVHALDQYLLDKSSILSSTPTILPAIGWITSYFGQRISPYAGKLKMHEGLDVGAPYGTPIVAPADGLITFSGVKAGFGKFVQIDHGYGIETLYAHSQSLHVKKGKKIRRGELIAKVGSTGYSTGPHLHYEVRVNGIAVDPLYFVLENN
jgi:murein DD-endopeptidase MepM/ murein hydrolase activator NlpD